VHKTSAKIIYYNKCYSKMIILVNGNHILHILKIGTPILPELT